MRPLRSASRRCWRSTFAPRLDPGGFSNGLFSCVPETLTATRPELERRKCHESSGITTWVETLSNPMSGRTPAGPCRTRNHYRIRRLVSPKDEEAGLSKSQVQKATGMTVREWEKDPRGRERPKRPSGLSLRTVRPATEGLLLLYGCRSDIYNGVNNLQAHYRWYVTDCF